tara:strand:+ start:177 stop:521 length:345 start_codon:yes stop_codon:yes gene_type:complete
MKYFLFSMTFTFLAVCAHAVDNQGRAWVYGGDVKCSQMSQEIQTTERYGYYKGWADGYFSGLNLFKKGTENFLDGSIDLARWRSIEIFCKKNPNLLLIDAANVIVISFYGSFPD